MNYSFMNCNLNNRLKVRHSGHGLKNGFVKVCNSNGFVIQMSGIQIPIVSSLLAKKISCFFRPYYILFLSFLGDIAFCFGCFQAILHLVFVVFRRYCILFLSFSGDIAGYPSTRQFWSDEMRPVGLTWFHKRSGSVLYAKQSSLLNYETCQTAF